MSSTTRVRLADSELQRLYTLNFGRTFVTFLLYHKFPLLFEELGLTGSQRGDIFSIVPLFAILATFWLGVLSDRVDARYVASMGLILIACFLVGVANTTAYLGFLVLFALSGIANQAFTIGTNAYFFKGVGKGRDKSVHISKFGASSSFGIAAAFLTGPLLVKTMGLQTALHVGAFIALCFVPLLMTLRPAKAQTMSISGYFKLFKNKQVFLFATMIFLFAFHWGTETTCYTPFLVHNLKLQEHHLGFFMGPPILMLGCSTLIFGRLGQKSVGPLTVLFAAFFLSGAGAIGMVTSSSVKMAFVWRLIHEAGDGAYLLFMLDGINRLFSEERAGGCAGLVWFTAMCSSALSSFIAAPIGAQYGYALPQAAAGALALISILGIPLLRGQKEKEAEPIHP